MKRIRNGEMTQSKVIDGAEVLFSRHGFSGTSIRMIAEESGYSVGLILHHFKAKENLYRIVRDKASLAYIEFLKKNLQYGGDRREIAKRTALSAFQYFTDHPSYLRLVWWAYLEGKELFSENERMLTLKTFEMIRFLQKQGIIRKNIDPQVILSVLLGAIHYWLSRGPILQELSQTKSSHKTNKDFFVQDLMKLILKNKSSGGKCI